MLLIGATNRLMSLCVLLLGQTDSKYNGECPGIAFMLCLSRLIANLSQRFAPGVNYVVSQQSLTAQEIHLGKALSGCTRAGNSCRAGVFHT